MFLHPTPSLRAARISLATLLAAVLCAIGFAPPAQASEFNPVPKITYLAQCFGNHQGLHVSFVLSNEGQGVATFHLVETVDGVVVAAEDFSVLDTPATPDYFITENKVPSFSVTSGDGPGASFQYTFGAVDCEADPTASIAVVCPIEPGASPSVAYTYFNPSAYTSAFSFSGTGVATFGFDAGSMAAPLTERRTVAQGTSLQAAVTADGATIASIDVVVSCIEPTTTTQATTTTALQSTTTIALGSTTVAPPSSRSVPRVSGSAATAPPDATGVRGATLARTGSKSIILTSIGATLVGLGSLVLVARRRVAR